MSPGWALAIETSGRAGSVALGRDGEILETRQFSADLRHAVELLPTIDAMCRAQQCDPAQIAGVFISVGPGSFTGLRIGVTVARTIAWAGNASIVAVPTLDVIAQNARDTSPAPGHLGVILDAKRGHIFGAPFELHDGRYVAMQAPNEHDPGEFVQSLHPSAALLGEGIQYHREALSRSGRDILPNSLNRARAETVYQIGLIYAAAKRFTDPAMLTPIYIRRPEAEEKWEAKVR